MHLSVLTTLCAFILVTSAQDSPLTTPTLLPFYIPFPLASSGDYITSYTNDKFWKHEYRNYHVSVISARGDYVYYVIDCRPNLDHPSCTEPWACPQSVVCAEEIVEAGRMTATQKGLGRLDFSFRWDECSKTTVGQSSQTCPRYEYRCSSSTAVDQTTRPCAKYENMRWTWDEVQDGTSYLEMSSLGHLSSAAKMLVTIGYGGADKVPATMLISMLNEAEAMISGTLTASSTAHGDAAPKATGRVGREALFGAAGALGAAVFGL